MIFYYMLKRTISYSIHIVLCECSHSSKIHWSVNEWRRVVLSIARARSCAFVITQAQTTEFETEKKNNLDNKIAEKQRSLTCLALNGVAAYFCCQTELYIGISLET